MERNGTNWFLQFDYIKKQQSLRKTVLNKNEHDFLLAPPHENRGLFFCHLTITDTTTNRQVRGS